MANFFLIFSLTVGIFFGIIVAWYNSQEIPKGLPDDQLMGLRVFGTGMDILRFLVRTLAAVDYLSSIELLLNVGLGRWNHFVDSQKFFLDDSLFYAGTYCQGRVTNHCSHIRNHMFITNCEII